MASIIITLALAIVLLFATTLIAYAFWSWIKGKKRMQKDKDNLFPAIKSKQSVLHEPEKGEFNFNITGGDKIGHKKVIARIDDGVRTQYQTEFNLRQYELENIEDVFLGIAEQPVFSKKGSETEKVKELTRELAQKEQEIELLEQKVSHMNDSHYERKQDILDTVAKSLKSKEAPKTPQA